MAFWFHEAQVPHFTRNVNTEGVGDWLNFDEWDGWEGIFESLKQLTDWYPYLMRGNGFTDLTSTRFLISSCDTDLISFFRGMCKHHNITPISSGFSASLDWSSILSLSLSLFLSSPPPLCHQGTFCRFSHLSLFSQSLRPRRQSRPRRAHLTLKELELDFFMIQESHGVIWNLLSGLTNKFEVITQICDILVCDQLLCVICPLRFFFNLLCPHLQLLSRQGGEGRLSSTISVSRVCRSVGLSFLLVQGFPCRLQLRSDMTVMKRSEEPFAV